MALIGGVLLMSGVCAAPAGAVTAQQAIAMLNAERAKYGIPADIVEDSAWSVGCAKHNAYRQLNGWGDNPHDEDPSKPGYTPEGQAAAQSAVLGGAWNDDGVNPYWGAPIHYMQTMGPALSVTGYADGCLYTWPGYNRAEPDQPQLFSIPTQGTEGVQASYTAREWPFVPGDFVALPEGTTTGPHLYLFAFGQSLSRMKITAASLTGPRGAEEVRWVDNTTKRDDGKSIGGYLPAGGILIPVAPLVRGGTYTASATLESQSASWPGAPKSATVTLHRTWSFTTEPKQAPLLDVEFDQRRYSMTSASGAPPIVRIYRLPSRTAVLTADAVKLEASGGTWEDPGSVSYSGSETFNLPGAQYELCVEQAETDMHLAASQCVQRKWASSPRMKFSLRKTRRRATITVAAGAAAGQPARIKTSFDGKTRTRKVTLSDGLRIKARRGSLVNVTVRAFVQGELRFWSVMYRRWV